VPPPKTVVDGLVKDLDVDGSGSIDEDEFKVLATVLCKNVASRVVVEMLFALVVGPLVAAIVLWLIDALFPPILSWFLPVFIEDMVTSLRTTVTVAIVLATAVPKLLAQIDSFFDVEEEKKEN